MLELAPKPIVISSLFLLHGTCVVAMYLGRVVRVNSWDAVLAPGPVVHTVLRVPRPSTVLLLMAMFVFVGAVAFATRAVGAQAMAQVRRFR